MSRNKHYRKLIHSRKWKEVRDKKIQMNPLCEICGNLAQEVHHIKPLEQYTNNLDVMEDMAYRMDNLQCLCHQCHKNIHIEMKLHRNQKESIKKNNKEKTDDFFNRYFE